jgi:hypothetical protein
MQAAYNFSCTVYKSSTQLAHDNVGFYLKLSHATCKQLELYIQTHLRQRTAVIYAVQLKLRRQVACDNSRQKCSIYQFNIQAEDPDDLLPENKYQRMVWEAFESPTSSVVARILAVVSLGIILISIVVFCIESLPSLKDMKVWFLISAACNAWFTVEYIIRLACAKSKLTFLKGTLNIIDIMSILPFYIDLIMKSVDATGGALEVLRVLRVVRVVRIFKLTRHSRG